MSAPENRSWDELINTLRTAAGDVRSALGRVGSPRADDDPAATRLKGDVSRLEKSASELFTRISAGLQERRSDIETSLDREQAQRTVEQMKTSLEELADLAGRVTTAVASAANSTLEQSEPELKNVVRALEDVAGSSAAWLRSAIDPTKEQPGARTSRNRPPLDGL